ncbi:MAG: endolytic transglycosylase MltG [Alphaproteobacteria bacterium]|nr:endolytic transglycosylase MltG [Alphaproteobacteria bacterium]MDX5368399.1 endolytic transglycosylase MltG [Alphaproteobacteria bacterium]MDX5463194.1 endolytic transglycosylase MltG [Alphaproteobacteria bacterium]
MRVLSTLVSGLLLIALIAGGIALYGAHLFQAPGTTEEPVVVQIPRGTGLGGAAAILDEAGVISDRTVFVTATRVRRQAGAIKAGEYEIPAGASMASILDLLVAGKTVQHRLTIPEGLTVAEALDLVRAHEVLSGDLTVIPSEGMMKPDTYLFGRGETRDALVARMVEAQRETLARLWEGRQEGLPIATPEEALTLASIVEKETGLAEERPRVAAVFVNRLRKGMLLQSDPTVIYGVTKGSGPLGRPIRRSDLRNDNPYNTYVRNGLPPGPIALPGEAAIAAVLDPPETRDLFFVADGTGGHAFAETLAEHNRNVARWRKIERERNGNN